jgi:tripartite-type tricarboxylate transporter receptor subunit TctC
MKKKSTKIFLIIFAVVSMLFCANQAKAEYPVDKLNIIVPFGTGGTTDRISRAMAQFLQKELGVPVVVVNRSGGAGLVGTKAHLETDPADGSFIAYTLQPYLSGQIVKGAYTIDDFDYIGINYWSPQAIWVRKDSRFKTLNDMLEAIKKEPNKIKSAFLANAWSAVVNGLLEERLNSTIKGIPYDGGGSQRMAVISGDVDFSVSDFYGTIAAAAADMKMLAIFEKDRHKDYPDVPTINDVMNNMGYKRMPILSNFRFYFVKKGFKQKFPDRWKRLVSGLEQTCKNPELLEMMKKQKLTLQWKGPEEATELIKESHDAAMRFKDYWK